MIIKKIDFYKLLLRRQEKFVIATGSSTGDTNIFVRLKCSSGITGYGSCACSNVMRESSSMVIADLKRISKKLVGMKVEIEPLHYFIEKKLRTQAAKAALDIALYDVVAKENAKPLYKFLNRYAQYDKFPTDMTIGITDIETTVRKAIQYTKKGFKSLKIKTGLNMIDDVNRIAEVQSAIPKSIKIRVDANQGYSIKDALQFIKLIVQKNVEIEFIEQPVDATSLKALKAVKNASTIPIMADESMKTVEDAEKIAVTECADLLNIKLMKCGGIYNAEQINNIALRYGLGVMVGCMGESKLSISAATHFALAHKFKNIRYADLDSHFELKNDPAFGNPMFENGSLILTSKKGLGTHFFFY